MMKIKRPWANVSFSYEHIIMQTVNGNIDNHQIEDTASKYKQILRTNLKKNLYAET